MACPLSEIREHVERSVACALLVHDIDAPGLLFTPRPDHLRQVQRPV